MEEKIIKKSQINKLLEEVEKEYKIFAPVEKEDDFRFSPLVSSSRYSLPFDGYRNTKISPKEIFLPQTDTLYEFMGQEAKPLTPETLNTLIFGIRPCDAQAISFLDKVFIEEDVVDPYYLTRREQTITISLACSKPHSTCFCPSVGGKPDNLQGSDIILFDLEEDILVEPVTAKGKEFIENFNKWFKEAKKCEIEQKNKLMDLSLKKIQSEVKIENIPEKLAKSFNISFWDEIHQRCLGCGICSYLCPTCYCFEITDEKESGAEPSNISQGKRMRCWASCMFPLFTREASGHNPRPSAKERLRQRIMHKFSYCPENFKEIFCTGCGRCVRNCPVNLDLREILTNVVKS
jgi:ferredoxin